MHIGTLLMDHPKVTSLVFPTVDEVAVHLHVLLARVKKDPTSCQSGKSDTAFGYFHEYLQNVSLIVGIFIFGTLSFMGCDTVVMFNLLNPYIIPMKIVC